MTQPLPAPSPTAGVDHAGARFLQRTGYRRDRCRPNPGLGGPVGHPALKSTAGALHVDAAAAQACRTHSNEAVSSSPLLEYVPIGLKAPCVLPSVDRDDSPGDPARVVRQQEHHDL